VSNLESLLNAALKRRDPSFVAYHDKGKCDIYRAQPSCRCVLLVRQDRPEIMVDRRTDVGWRSQVLGDADELAVPEFGFFCPVKDVYRDTPIG
jgi:Uma2 family endonuclease